MQRTEHAAPATWKHGLVAFVVVASTFAVRARATAVAAPTATACPAALATKAAGEMKAVVDEPPTVLDRSLLHQRFGAHAHGDGVLFRVYLPAAKKVELLLQRKGATVVETIALTAKSGGEWEHLAAGVVPGDAYVLRIVGANDVTQVRTDPFSNYTVPRAAGDFPGVEGVWKSVFAPSRYVWKHPRPQTTHRKLFYEVHAGSYLEGNPDVPIGALVRQLLPTLKKHRFTHLALMPLAHHPHRSSWGYLVGSGFSVDYRHGTPDDYREAIDFLHGHGIAVIWDLVHGHASKDLETGLDHLDGTQMYFHEGEDGLEHRYDSLLPRFQNRHVTEFYLSNARYWFDEFRVDGFRVDAIEIFLYYVTREGNRQHKSGGLEYLQHLTELVERLGGLSIGEDTSGYLHVTAPRTGGGLGFDLKWGVGTAHHVREFFGGHDPARQTLGYLLEPLDWWNENAIHYPESHDEANIKHGKVPFLRLPREVVAGRGDPFRYSRAMWTFLSYVFPGPQMVFMGNEFANDFRRGGWSPDDPVRPETEWKADRRRVLHDDFFAAKSAFYFDQPAFTRGDLKSSERVHVDERNRVGVQMRLGTGPDDSLLVLYHFGREAFPHYRIPVPAGDWEIVFDSNAEAFSGNPSPTYIEKADQGAMNGWPSTLDVHNLEPASVLVLRRRAVAKSHGG